jgi:uncharacterized protein YkwD
LKGTHIVKLAVALLLTGTVLGTAGADDTQDKLVQKIIALSNQVRQENGIRPVSQLNYLNEAARGHSQEMASLKYFSHTSPTVGRERPKNRIEQSGGWDLSIAENIYRAAGIPENEIAEDVVDAWMNSPVHRANLLNPKYNSMGIGIARIGKDEWAITQLFSLQTVAIDRYQATPGGGGYEVSLKGRVIEGADQGGVLYQEKVINKWSSRNFDSNFRVDGDGKVMIGQKDPDGQYSVELEFPVGARVATPIRSEVPPFGSAGKKVKPK